MLEVLITTTKKIVFDASVTFEQRLAIRSQLQDEFPNFILSLNSENDLIIRHYDSKLGNN